MSIHRAARASIHGNLRIAKLLLVFFLGQTTFQQPQQAAAQVRSPLLTRPWKAEWITCPKAPPRDAGVCYLRKSFDLPSAPGQFLVHVSADNRYELFVNGARVSRGPSRGDLDHWRFETVNLAPQLRAGKNVLAAVIWNYADEAPMAQLTSQTGFVLEGDNPVVNTDQSWKTLLDHSRSVIVLSEKEAGGYYAAGHGERVAAAQYPWGWQDADYDAGAWIPPLPLGTASPRAIQDTRSRWMLVADPLPAQEETLQRLARVVRSEGANVSLEFTGGHAPVTVPANTEASLLLDQSFETTTYPELITSGGRGSQIRITYAEALFDSQGHKGNRNKTGGKKIRGLYDEFLPDGGAHRAFSSLWWRAYRYVQIDVRTGDAPLTIEDFRGYFTAYPFKPEATFGSDDPVLQKIWEVGWRTARLCAHETYMDCPYYEQLQYVGDTRIQALISLYVAGDDRLDKNAIDLLGDSQTPEGLTQSRYPSALPQYIPPFSLYWIGMMHDLWWYRGEQDFLKPWLPNAREVLAWYQSHLTASGLLDRLPWWPFVDWADDFRDGVAPQEADGQSSDLSLEFVMALRQAADLEAAFGDSDMARRERALAAKIASAVYRTCWDAGRGLLADTPAKNHFSQQGNILGVLSDAIPAAAQRGVTERVLQDKSLTQASYYFRFYLARAMNKTGLAGRYIEELAPWKEMLNEGLTTFAETPGETRSDCHAWSAHPDFDLLATVAGIESAAPGFARVTIAPHLGELHHLTAAVPHSQGPIRVTYERQGDHWTADVALPAGLSGWFIWKERRIALHPGEQRLTL
ncbi:MAG TPA: alpha-L-rhamnosidase C-terminal domain-containing protein [Terriglobia bacterium]|nr:alpha-L-rhamnosidase C-terminal domain-containing protein [Terriglobia bacterium]